MVIRFLRSLIAAKWKLSHTQPKKPNHYELKNARNLMRFYLQFRQEYYTPWKPGRQKETNGERSGGQENAKKLNARRLYAEKPAQRQWWKRVHCPAGVSQVTIPSLIFALCNAWHDVARLVQCTLSPKTTQIVYRCVRVCCGESLESSFTLLLAIL